MRAIVLSDTHSEEVPGVIFDEIKKADLVIHAGDFCDASIYRKLKQLKEIHSVYGNMDGLDLRGMMPRKAIFACGGLNIGLIHGEGGPEMLVDKVRDAFKGEKVDVVVFGHSHQSFNEIIDGVLYFNPGSPTDTIRAAYRSYGVLEMVDGKVKGKIIRIK